MKKIGIIVPWDSPFMFTANAFNMLNWEHPEGYELKFIMGVGWCPASRHNDGVAKAQHWGADFIMFNGGDHICPKDIVKRMLKRIDEGWDIVQAMIPCRGICGATKKPFEAMSYKIVGEMPIYSPMIHANPKSVHVIKQNDEPQETHVSGTGNILMKAEIFKGLERPYFKEQIKEDGLYGRWCVQDSYFVYRCTVLGGAKMFCDTTIKLMHLDVFPIDETYTNRFVDKVGQESWKPMKDISEYV